MNKCSCILLAYDPFRKTNSKKNISKLIINLIDINEIEEIIIVCNDSMDNNNYFLSTIENIILKNSKIKIIKLNKNIGASKGFNLGMKNLNDNVKFVCFISLDLYLLDNNIFKYAIHHMNNDQSIGILHPISCFEDNDYFNSSKNCSHKRFLNLSRSIKNLSLAILEEEKVFESLIKFNNNLNIRDISIVNTSRCPLTLCFFSIKALTNISGFDEKFISGGENIDLAIRMRDSGYRVVRLNYCVGHSRISFRLLGQGGGNESGSMKQISHKAKSYLSQKYGNWNIIYFKQIYGNFAYIFFYLKKIEKIIRQIFGIWPNRNW